MLGKGALQQLHGLDVRVRGETSGGTPGVCRVQCACSACFFFRPGQRKVRALLTFPVVAVDERVALDGAEAAAGMCLPRQGALFLLTATWMGAPVFSVRPLHLRLDLRSRYCDNLQILQVVCEVPLHGFQKMKPSSALCGLHGLAVGAL